ncbi:hypothetical protein MADA3029_680034 [Vibrio nigripulchritudo MADA3029]|uniref:Uncharacterized protein n=2 Tax=Vibrio nigripulchritudo TaxID=28173 RepID=U4KFY4_9VIBR|nr:hypothetical protein VIBNIAM115_400009 [Vibrio nigripulchritudo AM115]CCN43796.1 hypothetical protein VIBNIFTn2_610012 [Vibrio nigripulchritudo FTn2]CCN47329.1 hypothetical protein VIBNIMADA3020_360034 [Vibrio nigripulchritudo MADA3020]CCN55194.1 hypothetical protein VIBNIMADA3021_70034 [Vibrio nigripulchritudo MADA3021]CCN60973.1 hypothetical protein MADA3029_680034 [Vibrio nigripulchritudo MADA3029]CCN64631.1 hypothetical protein VIBNIPon4_250012 [Vibrio nigripulchritudo POn4]CCN72560.1 
MHKLSRFSCDHVFTLLKIRLFAKKAGVFDKYLAQAQNTLLPIVDEPDILFGHEIEENACLQQQMC